jgi:hypothetical protein
MIVSTHPSQYNEMLTSNVMVVFGVGAFRRRVDRENQAPRMGFFFAF